MKKHLFAWAIMITTMLMLSGCLGINANVTEEEINLTAEYAAALLLKYDANYEPKLTTSIEVKEDPTLVEEEFETLPTEEDKKDEEEKDKEDKDKEDKDKDKDKDKSKDKSKDKQQEGAAGEIPDGIEVVKLQEMYDFPNISVRYKGYEERSSYPDNSEESYFSLVAASGKKLVVVSFSLMNKGDEKARFTQLDSKVLYRLNVDGDKYLKPSMTLLSNDIQYVNTELAPKEVYEAVAVFSVDETSDMTQASIVVYDADRQSVTKLR